MLDHMRQLPEAPHTTPIPHPQRCFGDGNPLYEAYHDTEWGVPSHDDRHLFELLTLEGAQAGLSWETILKKRVGYQTAFHAFDINRVAEMSDEDLERLLQTPTLIRNRRKIFSVRQNARGVLALQKEYGSFATYLWAYVEGVPVQNHFTSLQDVPTSTPISQKLSRDLKVRGMSFVGPTIMYAFMQAVGLVNDHLTTCPCYNKR